MSDIFGIAPEDKACLECEMIKEAIKATEKRIVDEVIEMINSITTDMPTTAYDYTGLKILKYELRKKYGVTNER